MFLNSKRLCVDERALEFIGLGCGGYVWQNRHSFRALQRSQANLCVCVMLQGGNDYEIYCDTRTIGHEVSCPEETLQLCQQLFFSWERETIREQVSVYVLSFFKRPRGKSSNQTSSSFVEIWPRGLITYIINSKQKEPVSWHLWRQWEEGLLGVRALNVMVNVPV